MTLAPQFLLARALRHRYLASKARKHAALSTGNVAQLVQLADRLERDAAFDEDEARALQMEAAEDASMPFIDNFRAGKSSRERAAAMIL